MNPATPAQKWARKRNWSKAQIKNMIGIVGRCREVATPDEHAEITVIQARLHELLAIWNSGNVESKKRYCKGR